MTATLDLLALAPADLADSLAAWEGGIAPGDVGLAVIEGGAEDWDAAADTAPEALADLNGAPLITVGVLREGELADGSAQLLGRCDLVVRGEDGGDLGSRVTELVELASRAPAPALVAAQLLRAGAGIEAESFAYSMLLAGPDFRAWREAEPALPAADAGAPRVRVDARDGAWIVRLTRPARHNAFDAEMREQLCDSLDAIEAGSRAPIVLLGDGPSFCSGGDLDEFGSAEDPVTAHLVRSGRSAARRLRRCAGRLVAGVHGSCIGAGVELAAFAGLVAAAEGSTFALPEIAVGLNLGSGGAVSIPERIGRQRTLELLMRPEAIDAETAREWGLVDRVVAAAELESTCVEAAARLAEERS